MTLLVFDYGVALLHGKNDHLTNHFTCLNPVSGSPLKHPKFKFPIGLWQWCAPVPSSFGSWDTVYVHEQKAVQPCASSPAWAGLSWEARGVQCNNRTCHLPLTHWTDTVNTS